MRRARLAVALVFAIAIVGGAAWYFRGEAPDDGRLLLFGNVDVRQVNLAFKVPGRLARMAAEEGDAVAGGDALAQLDRVYFEDEVRLARARAAARRAMLAELEHGTRPEEIAQARAAVAERRAVLENARRVFARQEGLLARGNTSRQAFDNARAALHEAEARLKSAEEALVLAEAGPRAEQIAAARAQLEAEAAALVQAERRLADATLVAPGPGTIVARVREPGSIVAAGETVYLLTLTDPVWVRTWVVEPDLGRIRPGMPAEIRTDSAPGEFYRGHVGFISPVAEFTPKSVETRELRTDLVYRLRVIVHAPDEGLRQGMPVTVMLRPE